MTSWRIDRRRFLELSGAAIGSAKVGSSQSQTAPSREQNLKARKFLVGTEYYRAPMPPQEFWDKDFAAIRRCGMQIVRTFSYWNWIEPQQGRFELDDFDLFFELARKHDLLVWFDLTLSTHGAAPEWMMRKHPDMRVVSSEGHVAMGVPGNAAPQGMNYHCYDHPKWKEYGEEFLRTVVGRYRDSPNLLMWNVWDGISPQAAAPGCYCTHSLAAYREWLQQNFTLDQLNQRLLRRYRDWQDVQPPRGNAGLVEMLLWREFQYQDLKMKAKWQVSLVRSIDPKHEIRAHGGHWPQYWDEMCSEEFDSWGYSAPTNNVLTSDDPYRLSNIFVAADWSRSIGRGGRWWYEEIYSGMNPGGIEFKRNTTPEEITFNMWLALARGATGVLFWQYRPEYFTYEAPGLNLVSLAGDPLPRLKAVTQTIREMSLLEDHLPLTIPKADLALVYHDKSHMMYEFGKGQDQYRDAILAFYRTFWQHNIPVDVITPKMDWSQYKIVCLPNTVLLDEQLAAKIAATVQNQQGTHVLADGLLGMNAASGRFSYAPPEGLSGSFGVKTLDYTRLTTDDIRRGQNKLRTENGSFEMTGESNYVGLSPSGKARAIAWYGDDVVGMESSDRRFTWITLSLATAFENPTRDQLLLGLIKPFGINEPVKSLGDRVIIQRAKSKLGGWLLFLFNFERTDAQVELEPGWGFSAVEDLVGKRPLTVQKSRFAIEVPSRGVKLVYVS